MLMKAFYCLTPNISVFPGSQIQKVVFFKSYLFHTQFRNVNYKLVDIFTLVLSPILFFKREIFHSEQLSDFPRSSFHCRLRLCVFSVDRCAVNQVGLTFLINPMHLF